MTITKFHLFGFEILLLSKKVPIYKILFQLEKPIPLGVVMFF